MTHPRRRAGGRTAGLTLVEMLVVLVLASLLGTVIVQGTGFFLGQYAQVRRTQLDGNEAALFADWFGSTVAAALPSRVEGRQFAGGGSAFAGVTLQPLADEPGRPVRFRWSIAPTDPPAVVYAEGDGEPWTVLRLPPGAAAFRYADSDGRWHTAWPPTPADRHRTPRLVRLVAAGDRTLVLARSGLSPDPAPNYREQF